MISQNTSPNPTNLNDLCLSVLRNEDEMMSAIEKLSYEPDWIVDNYFGIVDESVLTQIIALADISQSCENLVLAIFDAVDDSSITDNIIDKAFSIESENLKEQVLIILSHKHLSENQLIRLCETKLTFECYYELAALYYSNKQFSIQNLKDFLESFKKSPYSEQYNDLIAELLHRYHASNESKKTYVFEQRTTNNSFIN